MTVAPAVNQGIYTIPFASRLLGMSPQQVSRWAFGHSRGDDTHPPVIAAELEPIDGVRALTFLELVEVMFVRGLRERGQSLQRIREAWRVYRKLCDTDHPFALRRVFEDPAGVYAKMGFEPGDEYLVELRGAAQLAMFPTLEKYLRQLDFDVLGELDLATRWYPAGRDRPIIVDPRLAFGAPVVAGTATTTAVLFDLAEKGADAEGIAWWYDLDIEAVDAALEWEKSLRTESPS